MFQTPFPLYAIVILRLEKVQNFNINQWSSDKLMEHWQFTIQSQAHDFNFNLIWTYFSYYAKTIYIPSSR